MQYSINEALNALENRNLEILCEKTCKRLIACNYCVFLLYIISIFCIQNQPC